MSDSSSSNHRVLVYGGAGALGRAIVTTFVKAGSKVDSADFVVNHEASKNYTLEGAFEESLKTLVKTLKAEGDSLFDVVVCAAGGWAGGSLKGDTEDLLSSFSKMHQMNTQSALAASHIAALFLKPSGLVVLTGANAARSGTSGMIAYGMSKAATHQLAQSLSAELSKNERSSTVVTILPITLDTPSNRSAMPNADTSTWTQPSEIAETIKKWSSTNEERPSTGSMFLIETKDSKTTWSTVKTEY